jgi:glycosyltransferase involved in cell wall biosynthesis
LGIPFDIKNTEVCTHHDNSCINNYTKIVIFPPAVDTNKFSKKFVKISGGTIINPLCLDDCINIGFIARLSIEKNVGLFLMMASLLLKTYPNVRFTIIGDGPLRKDLTILAQRLNISNFVLFTGWVDDKLPHILSGIDIIINTSLRAWAETFCISNIEVMSMSIPIVTFGVGGTGEYIDNPNNYNDDGSFTITSNSVVVHEATPISLYNATRILIMNSTLRHQLGEASRGIIISSELLINYCYHYHCHYRYDNELFLFGTSNESV